MIRVAFVHQHDFFHDSFQAICEQNKDNFQFVFSVHTPDQVLSRLNEEEIDVLATGINFPLEKGISMCKSVHEIHPKVRILAISPINDPVVIKDLFAAGVACFLEKKESFGAIARAIRELHEKGFYYPYDMSRIFDPSSVKTSRSHIYVPDFSAKELIIVRLTRKELSNQEIARELGLSVKTVESHKRNLCEKTNSKKMIGVIEYLLANNIIPRQNL